MRATVMRVSQASVSVRETALQGPQAPATAVSETVVSETVVGEIGRGLLVLVGVAREDDASDVTWMARKLLGMRIFQAPCPAADAPEPARMSASIRDVGGAILLVSQFTLFGDLRRGQRPSFSAAAPPAEAEALYLALATALKASGVRVETGVFRASMGVSSVNDGPITLWLDSRERDARASA